jgi:hypothetical protein
MEEEMAAVMKRLENAMIGVQSKMKRGDSEVLRLSMNVKMQQAQIASFKRQLADADERMGKGLSKSKRDVEVLEDKLKVAVGTCSAATVQSESMLHAISLLAEEYNGVLQQQKTVCACLDKYIRTSRVAKTDLQQVQTIKAENDMTRHVLNFKVSSGLQELTNEIMDISIKFLQVAADLDATCQNSADEMNALQQRTNALDAKVAGERELVDTLNQRLAEAKRESLAWEKCADQRQAQCETR